MCFESKVADSPGNNYLITSVLCQNSITITESVSDFCTVVHEMLVGGLSEA